jgi:hypothetical protein|tara:strand:+ start:572 stop:805 length:234 start_codon:yes stop_codon:yes gene_type:complete
MRNLIILVLLFLSVSVNAQQREQRGQKCIKTTVVEKQGKVHVTTNNTCTKKKTTKVYTKQEWQKILADRKKRRGNRG